LKKYSEFHDGHLDGLILEKTSAYVLVGTSEAKLFTFEAVGVTAVSAGTFRQGNIIFDVILHSCDELTLDHMIWVQGPLSDFGHPDQAQKWLNHAQRAGLVLLEINPSYGATCYILARSIELNDRKRWMKRYTNGSGLGHGTEK
jgi:hypothetical protein